MPLRPSTAPDLAPLIVLREALAEQRSRGVEFDEAWPAALAAIEPLALTCRERRNAQEGWGAVLDATRDARQRAYCGEPAAPHEIAVADLVDALPDRLLYDLLVPMLELAAERAGERGAEPAIVAA